MESLRKLKITMLAVLLGIGLVGGLTACTINDGWRGYDFGGNERFHEDLYR